MSKLHASKLQNFPPLKNKDKSGKSQTHSAVLLQTQKTKAGNVLKNLIAII